MSSRTPLPKSFQTTRWSIVLQAGAGEPEAKQEALAALCRDYWFPVYAFVRQHGHDHHDAQDLTQGFFELILCRDGLGTARPERGRFRSYLLAAAKNFMANEHRWANAQKRGGGVVLISLDSDGFDDRFQLEAASVETPELLYHRSWANTLLLRVMDELGGEYDSAGKGELFFALRDKLAEPRGESSNETAASKLGMSKGAVGVALHRMRGRYRELLRRHVAETLAEGETDLDVDAEIQQLLAPLD